MCMSCGCGSSNDKHGDYRSITLNDLDLAVQAAGIGVGQAVQNIVKSWQQMSPSPETSGEPSQYGLTLAETAVLVPPEQNQQVPSLPQGQQNQYGLTLAETAVLVPPE